MMKFYPSWFVFFLVNIIGLSLIFSSGNWFMVWMGFELSLLGFLPMFIVSFLSIEGMVKYFLVQAVGSVMFLFSFSISMSNYCLYLCVLGMLLKLGVFPFFQWLPVVMNCLSWSGCFFLSSVQKVGPLVVLFNVCMSTDVYWLVLFVGCMSILISGLLGFNQLFMRLLMGYSSIGQTGWVILGVLLCPFLGFSYFISYVVLLLWLFMFFGYFGINKVVWVVNKSFSLFFVLLFSVFLVSLSGFPPFSIFMLKLLILSVLKDYLILVVLAVLGSYMTIYYYFVVLVSQFVSRYSSFFISGVGSSGGLVWGGVFLQIFVNFYLLFVYWFFI